MKSEEPFEKGSLLNQTGLQTTLLKKGSLKNLFLHLFFREQCMVS